MKKVRNMMRIHLGLAMSCLLFAGGCSILAVIMESKSEYFQRCYPGVKSLMSTMDVSQAKVMLLKMINESAADTWRPHQLLKRPIITDSGLECTFKILIPHTAEVAREGGMIYYRKWETREPDEEDSLDWTSVTRLRLMNHIYTKYGDCQSIYVSGKWNSVKKRDRFGFSFSVFTEAQRDKVIAALLTLCPNI